MTNRIEHHEASGSIVSDYFYFENGYYHRAPAVENRGGGAFAELADPEFRGQAWR